MSELPFRLEPGERPGEFRLEGDLDLASTAGASALLGTLPAEPKVLTLDLSAVTFVDSSGVRLLLEAWRSRRDAGGDLVFWSPTATVRRLFDVLGLQENGVRVEPATEGT